MTSNTNIAPLTVAELFGSGQYFIPIYQRNYAWGEPEVKQLLQDVLDEAQRFHSGSDSADNYYIGTLVVDDKGGQHFETIDGQQRHTTLSVVLSALKNEFGDVVAAQDAESGNVLASKLKKLSLNLAFENRDKSTNTLALLEQGITEGCEQASMHCAYDVAVRFFEEHKRDLYALTHYLLNNVIILRVAVPEGTDLNHYFEIMNNRGEQLEKHEVLKARLMRPLSLKERRVFSTVWDACASMDRYAPLGFERALRFKLFGDKWQRLPQSFDAVMQQMADNEAPEAKRRLDAIIQRPELREKQTGGNGKEPEQYGSIINFPNFLLQVLRITTVSALDADTPLDDKRLLVAFKAHFDGQDEEACAAFAREFVVNLLKCRLLFDRFIIKRKNDLDWSLEQLTPNDSSHHYVMSGGELNQQLIMQLSMFHVSFPTQVYKHWLSAAMFYLLQQHQEGDFSVLRYTQFLDRLNDKIFYGRFGQGEQADYFSLCFDDAMPTQNFDHDNLKQGTHIQNFIFNRLDYRLWQSLQAGRKFDVDMGFIQRYLDKFSFTFRTSVEHYFPQHPIAGESMDKETLHSFGNLCLISHSDNSKYSNHDPATKKKQAEDKLTREELTESLKQVFMMSYSEWGPENTAVIAEHEKMMVEALCG